MDALSRASKPTEYICAIVLRETAVNWWIYAVLDSIIVLNLGVYSERPLRMASDVRWFPMAREMVPPTVLA